MKKLVIIMFALLFLMSCAAMPEESTVQDTSNATEDTKEDYFAMLQPYVQKLFKVEPEYIAEQVEIALGAGRKVTDATDDEVSKLATLYMVLVDHCNQMNISV